MIVYHGTTRRRALRICEAGFLPRKPSRRVWFAEGRGYALGRAKTQARRAHARPVVLTCDVDLSELRRRLGQKRVFHRNRVIAIHGPVPITVLRSHPAVDFPTAPRDLAMWVNRLLGLKSHKGVGHNHPGILRLSKWVINRIMSQPKGAVRVGELVEMARQWLPEYFDGVEVDLVRLRAHPRPKTIEVAVTSPPPTDPREDKAVELLEDHSPKRRVRGLAILAEIEDPDIFDWCTMFLNDDSPQVRVAALRTAGRCEGVDPGTIRPLAASQDERIRAAAIAALARHSGADAPGWFERGLKDPSPCVRVETAGVLSELDPTKHRAIFELALNDPNPDIAKRARKLTAHKGYGRAAHARGR